MVSLVGSRHGHPGCPYLVGGHVPLRRTPHLIGASETSTGATSETAGWAVRPTPGSPAGQKCPEVSGSELARQVQPAVGRREATRVESTEIVRAFETALPVAGDRRLMTREPDRRPAREARLATAS